MDISLSIESVGISTSVYYKSTDSHLYLDYQSNHSPSCKNAIPYSQFLRLRRLYSNDEDFKVKVNEISQFFLDRGYPLCVVTTAREKVFKTSRETLLYKKSSLNVSRKIPLVLKYNQFNSRILSIVRKNYLQYLSNDVDIGKMFENNFIGSFCNEKSLSNHLVKSKLNHVHEIPGTFRFNRTICNTCQFVSCRTSIDTPFHSFSIRRSFSCVSENIVYCIFCSKCNIYYVGETGRRLGDRFREHLSDIKNKRDAKSDVAKHFNLNSHTIEDVNVCGLLYCNNTTERKQKEMNLIRNLGTLKPLGLNKEG